MVLGAIWLRIDNLSPEYSIKPEFSLLLATLTGVFDVGFLVVFFYAPISYAVLLFQGTESRASIIAILRLIVEQLNKLFADGIDTPYVHVKTGERVRSRLLIVACVFVVCARRHCTDAYTALLQPYRGLPCSL
jgi:hypothetical protein